MDYQRLRLWRLEQSDLTDEQFIEYMNAARPGVWREYWFNYNTIGNVPSFGELPGLAVADSIADYLLSKNIHQYHKFLNTGFDVASDATRVRLNAVLLDKPEFAPVVNWLYSLSYVESSPRCVDFGFAQITALDLVKAENWDAYVAAQWAARAMLDTRLAALANQFNTDGTVLE